MHAILDRIEDVATNIKTFWFEPEKPVHYTAGQFTELYLPHDNPDERGIKHWFTLSSSPSEPLLSITTKFAIDRSSTFKQTLRALQPGARVLLADPMGDFVLPKDPTRQILFVAGGIGVTPMRSMTKWLLDNKEKRDIHLLYAANRPDELAFVSLFTEYYDASFLPIVKEADSKWQGQIGTLDAQHILDRAKDDCLIYLSGPEPMVEGLANNLKEQGVDKHRIVTDFFPGYTKY